MKKMLEKSIPCFTLSEANKKEHWSKSKKRHDMQKKWIWLLFKQENPIIEFPCTIKLTRKAKKKLDSDNLTMSLKWIRDAIADQIFPGLPPGRADDDSRLNWEYAQEIFKEYEVDILIYQN